jgi:hypothetical protein
MQDRDRVFKADERQSSALGREPRLVIARHANIPLIGRGSRLGVELPAGAIHLK